MGVRAISDPQKQGFHTSASDGIQVGQSDKEVGKLLLIRFSLAWLASVAACGRRAVRATATGPRLRADMLFGVATTRDNWRRWRDRDEIAMLGVKFGLLNSSRIFYVQSGAYYLAQGFEDTSNFGYKEHVFRGKFHITEKSLVIFRLYGLFP